MCRYADALCRGGGFPNGNGTEALVQIREAFALSLESLTEEERSMAISRDSLVTSIAVDV
jgi:hypothetical protein